MDANLLACPGHERLIEQLADSRSWVDFSQGLDIRLITPDNAALLNRVRTKTIHFAWDDCQRRCDFVVFRRTGYVEKWRVMVYSLCIIILAVFVRQA